MVLRICFISSLEEVKNMLETVEKTPYTRCQSLILCSFYKLFFYNFTFKCHTIFHTGDSTNFTFVSCLKYHSNDHRKKVIKWLYNICDETAIGKITNF